MGERRRPHQLEIERWLLDELSPAERARLERELPPEEARSLKAEDAALRERLLQRRPPAELAAEVSRRAARSRAQAPRVRWLSASLAITSAAAALSLLAWLPRGDDVRAPRAVLEERTKGLSPQVRVYRKRGEAAERLTTGARARAHDLLQLGYVAAGRGYGVLVSLDGRGTVTLHHPSEPGASSALEGGGEQLLASAYELDDAPEFERFILATSDEPLDAARVLAAAEALAQEPARAAHAPLALPQGVEQHSLLVRKERE